MRTRLLIQYLPHVCVWVDDDVADYHRVMHDDALVIGKLTDVMETQWRKDRGLPWGTQKDVMAHSGPSDTTKTNNETKPMKNILMNEASDDTVTAGTAPGEAAPSEATQPVPAAEAPAVEEAEANKEQASA